MADDATKPQGLGRKRRVPKGRAEMVEAMWAQGLSPRYITATVARKWACTRRTIRKDLERLYAKLAALPKPDPATVREQIREMLITAYQTAAAGGSSGPMPSAMVAAATRLAQLDGLLTEKIEHTISDAVDLTKLTDDELKTFLALREKTKTEK